jgi:quercetin dioxygenase-like cupin family protein
MKIEKPDVKYADPRGEIVDILVKEPVEYVTLIRSRTGAVRGNHFHRETLQWIYLLEGRLKVLYRMPGEPVKARLVEPGELFLNVVNEHHSVEAVEESTFIVLTRGPRGGDDYENDTFRLPAPLREGD